jgi:hypothetical protein
MNPFTHCILLLGVIGVGKPQFIRTATSDESVRVGAGLESGESSKFLAFLQDSDIVKLH